MNIAELKKKQIRDLLNIEKGAYSKIFCFIDFGNVNYWYEDDSRDCTGVALEANERLTIDIEGLKDFTSDFSDDARFYYGHDPDNKKSLAFLFMLKSFFGKNRVFTKPLQQVKHYLAAEEVDRNTRVTRIDGKGSFITIPKCNFDVEICVDAVKLCEKYDTFCLFSGDADFVHLLRFLKSRGKKVILIKGGFVMHSLAQECDLIINAQDIKKYITKKQKSDPKSQICGT